MDETFLSCDGDDEGCTLFSFMNLSMRSENVRFFLASDMRSCRLTSIGIAVMPLRRNHRPGALHCADTASALVCELDAASTADALLPVCALDAASTVDALVPACALDAAFTADALVQ